MLKTEHRQHATGKKNKKNNLVACWRCAVRKWLIIALKHRAGRLGQQIWLIIAVKRRAGRLGQQT